MAGIGFSLRKLFSRHGILNLCRAYGYAGVIAVGPMLLGVLLLVGVSFASRLGGMGGHDRELLNSMLTYSLLASLTVTSWFNMGTTRFISDMLYEEKKEKIMPSFYGTVSVMLVMCFVGYGTFLWFSGVRFIYKLLCLVFSLILIPVWHEMIYLTAVKDYKAIVLAFTVSILIAFLIILIEILLGFVSIVAFMIAIIIGYGILMCSFLKILLDYFPEEKGSNFSVLAWFDEYRSLVLAGGFINVGLFSHIIVTYFGVLAVQVEGLFYGAPEYDVPALFAFFSLLITTINFITTVEVRFYPKYRNYYGLFNDKGAIKDIQQAEHEMLSVLRRELTFAGHKQLFTTILFIVILPPILQSLPLGITVRGLEIFRFLCVGYGTYALANSMMLILLYFENYGGALIATGCFALISTATSIYQLRLGYNAYFGLPFFLGAIVFYVLTVIFLEYRTRKLPYYLLSKQNILPKSKKGPLVSMAHKLDERQDRIETEELLRKQEALDAKAKENILVK